MKFQILLFFAVASSLQSETPTAESALVADPYVVRASRIGVQWHKAPQSVTVVQSEALEAAETQPLGEILEGRSGASYMVRGNGFATAKSGIQMRSWAMGSEIVVAKDGRRLSNDTDGEGFDLSLIDLGSLESVELLRGASSSLYGSGAHAGVVNLVGRRPGSKPGAVLRSLGGSAGFEHLCLEMEQKLGPWGIRFSGSQQGAGDYWTPDYGTFRNTGQHRVTGSLLLEREIGADSLLKLSAQFGRGWDNGLPGDLYAPAPDDRDLSDDRGYGVAEWREKVGQGSEIKVSYDYGLKARENLRLGARGPARTRVDQQQLSRGQGLLASYDSLFGAHHLISGAEGRREDHSGSGWLQPPTGPGYASPKLPPSSVENASAFLQDEWDFNERLRVSIGARGDFFKTSLYESADVLFTPTASERSAPTAHLGLSYELVDGLSLKASGGNSYVAPNVIQLYTFNPRTGFALLGNPVLDPETGYSVDLGIAGSGRRWKGELTGFVSEMQNRLEMGIMLRDFGAGGNSFIDITGKFSRPDLLADPKLVNAPTNKWFYHYNLGVTQVQGFEGMGEIEFMESFFLAASFNLSTRMIETTTGRWLDSLPSFSSRVSIEKRGGGWEAYLVGRYGGAYDTVSRSRPGIPLVHKADYFIVDLSLRYEILQGLTLICSGKNLFNTAWQQTLDMPEPGLEGRLGMELSL